MRFIEIENEKIEIGSEEWAEHVMSYDPYEGDMDGGSTLDDKIVKVRSTKKLCHDCLSILQPGTFSRVIVSKDGPTLIKNRFCENCCNDQAFGEVLFEGNVYIDPYDDDAMEAACKWNEELQEWQEPLPLYEVRERTRSENEAYLIEKLGPRYFEAPDQARYEAMLSKA